MALHSFCNYQKPHHVPESQLERQLAASGVEVSRCSIMALTRKHHLSRSPVSHSPTSSASPRSAHPDLPQKPSCCFGVLLGGDQKVICKTRSLKSGRPCRDPALLPVCTSSILHLQVAWVEFCGCGRDGVKIVRPAHSSHKRFQGGIKSLEGPFPIWGAWKQPSIQGTPYSVASVGALM